MQTRREFALSCAAFALAGKLPAQVAVTRPNLAAVDHDRILAGAHQALERKSVAADNLESLAYLHFTLDVPALAAASLVDRAQADMYAAKAAGLLSAWFAALPAAPHVAAYEVLLDRCLLAEVAQAVPFLALAPALRAQVQLWFSTYLTFLTTDRTALLARDSKDHHGSSWLLQAASFAHLAHDDAVTAEVRHRFKTTTIRAQIAASGYFPHELTTSAPFRNSLFNLDLLAGACQLLSTPFESVWLHELQDGPGMRVAVARHVPFIEAPKTWPYPVDAAHFNLLPARRPALVFAARAYADAAYASLWCTLNPDPTDPDLLRAYPIRQPILWLTPPPAPAV